MLFTEVTDNMKRQRKPFTDMLGKPLKAEDVALAVRVAISDKTVTGIALQRGAGIGLGKGNKILALLERAGVVSEKQADGTRRVILRSEPMAINAALRKLREGNR